MQIDVEVDKVDEVDVDEVDVDEVDISRCR